jgi:hypothetical protein
MRTYLRAACIIKRTDRKTPDKGSLWNKYIREQQQKQQRKTTRKERKKKKKKSQSLRKSGEFI